MELGPILRSLRRHRARLVLIVAEVALTLAIVANCVTLILEARADMTRASGFDDDNLIWVETDSFASAFQDITYVRQVIDADRELLAALPNVRAAGNTGFKPWQGGGSSFEVQIQGSDRPKVRSQAYRADPTLFATLDVEVVAGRNFTMEEYLTRTSDQTAINVIVSRALAELLFDGEPALGRVLEDPQRTQTYTIVGVIDEFYNPYGWPIHEYVAFFPGRSGSIAGSTYLVRAEPGRVDTAMRDVEQALLAANDGRNVRVKPLLEIRDNYNLGNRVLVASLEAVMALLVLVTALGIVGLTSFSVAERTRQIGTRRALGARRVDIVTHFLMENWLLTTVALVLGCGLAVGVNIGIMSAAGGTRLGVLTVAAGVALLWVAGLLATLAPALRASRISPAIATRNV
jgi:putative ABC transport system permease protein